jgi:hypothetical protein
MTKVIKIALPGYNAYTDTDPDHFSLYVDQITDYVLIKEKLKNSVSVNGIVNIAHGLDYVPLCIVFAEMSSGVWRKLFSVPIDSIGCWFEVNNTNLILKNSTGSAKTFAYHIFYDNITSGVNNVSVTGKVVKVAKIGVNAESSNDPNDFVFHSYFNTFKIITELTKSITLLASTNNQSFTQSHGLSFIPLITAFAKQTTINQVFLPNSDNINLWGTKLGWTSTGVRFNYISADATNVTFNFDNTNATTINVNIRYFLLEKVN